jgi:hypothetical protein
MPAKKLRVFLMLCFMGLFVVQPAMADRLYTLTDDFLDEGNTQLEDVDPGNDQLQLSVTEIPYPFVNIAATGRGTIVRVDATSGDIVGEYRTAPQDSGLSATPSRITVDKYGNVWVANQGENGSTDGRGGSVAKIGVVIGGTRVSLDDEGLPVDDPSGNYLKGPFAYNTCEDREEPDTDEPDGYIKTSWGSGNVLAWPDNTDGNGGPDGIVEDAEDECILLFQRLPEAPNAQHVSVDANDDVWVGGYPGVSGYTGMPTMFYKLSGVNGAELDSFDARVGTGFGCGGFGGLVDDNGILWSASWFQNKLLHYNPTDGSGGCIDVTTSYALAESVIEREEASDVIIWNSSKGILGRLPRELFKIDAATFLIEDVVPTNVDGDNTGVEDRGVAVTPADNHVWVVKAGPQELRRFNSLGELLSRIPLVNGDNGEIAREPTGVTVDKNGKLWVANLGTDNVMRVDPAAGEDPAGGDDPPGAVDLTVYLGPAAAPNSYSDMTKVMPIPVTSTRGTWTVVHEGADDGTIWDVITWNADPQGSQPPGTTITVEAQTADDKNDLGDDRNYAPVSNGGPLSLPGGRFIKIRATLAAGESGASPVLYDLAVKSAQASMLCDVDNDGVIDIDDIRAIIADRRQEASGPDDLRDWNGDGLITIADARGCVLQCTNPQCAP